MGPALSFSGSVITSPQIDWLEKVVDWIGDGGRLPWL
jgi:hypothetical protein